jgi:hypothetical protein
MDDVQVAIVRVIKSLSLHQVGKAIAQLAFIAEFPSHFSKGVFRRVFVQACSTYQRPTGPELKPLMAFPNLVALMMQYREGVIQPDRAIWNPPPPSPMWAGGLPISPRVSHEDEWLDKELGSFGLT